MRTPCTVTTIVVLLCCPVIANEDVASAADGSAMTLEFYSLSELLRPVDGYAYEPELPTSIKKATNINVFPQVMQGQAGAGGGGGFFSVAENPPSDSAMVAFFESSSQKPDLMARRALVAELLQAHVDPESWEENGGEASISAIQDTLLIRQTATNHKAVRGFLNRLTKNTVGGQPVSMQIWWLPLDANDRDDLNAIMSKGVDVATLNGICDRAGGYHGSLNTRNKATANISAGHRMPLIVGRIPVVGTKAVGHQTTVKYVNVGIMAEATVHLMDSGRGNRIRLTLKTAVTSINNHKASESSGGDIDRFRLGNQVLQTTIMCVSGKPVIAGSLSAVGLETENADSLEMVVVVMLSDESSLKVAAE